MTKRSEKEKKILIKEYIKTERKEKKLFSAPAKEKAGLFEKINSKIPEKARNALEGAFKKGFFLLFEKGTPLFEKVSSADKIYRDSEEYRRSLDLMIHPETLKAVDKAAGGKINVNKSISAIEGAGLGLLGIGLPDIPVFLAMLLKASYEIAAAYGIDFREEDEKPYTLALFKTVFSEGEKQREYSSECDDLGRKIDDYELYDAKVSEDDLDEVAKVLAADMLVAKFIQGQTFVGAVGGIVNYRLVNKVANTARLKYKKRFLYRLMNGE